MATEAEKTSADISKNPFSGENIDPRRQIALNLTVIARLLRNNFDRKVATLNVTRSQWTLIAVVSRNPGATQRVIAEHLEMSEASAGRLIDRLCAEGLLIRRDRKDDRRARAIYLTEAATPLLEQLHQIATASEDRMFSHFSVEEIDQLKDFMARIYENVSRG
ncbi:MarR family winged helix-turn-helix transcriptional regulator [Novosphingobium mathurense]|uniref:DNA-binding transcriptional regulator, MarR family n=1 Tax=Novosphingobium mathurense TaxID=428990 RepID=A0A1U6H2J3_9SPHN|nr:MarR family transcriptional regulator [Novosphingobium mathurense]SLJ89890.1 DNA-binding transcriptional regulator, MarR family [Novosphingobium mathurense]